MENWQEAYARGQLDSLAALDVQDPIEWMKRKRVQTEEPQAGDDQPCSDAIAKRQKDDAISPAQLPQNQHAKHVPGRTEQLV